MTVLSFVGLYPKRLGTTVKYFMQVHSYFFNTVDTLLLFWDGFECGFACFSPLTRQ